MLRSVSREDALLEKAWALPSAQKYAPLLSQSWRSICGPTSVANVLRSIGVKSGNNPFSRFGVRAMSLDQIADESRPLLPSEWSVHTVRLPSVGALREELHRANQPTHRFIVNFSRQPIFGHGGGHHSPIGGYLETEDLVLVLDVNAGYGPWLVSAQKLFDAVNTFDRGDGQSRGLARFDRT
ncbi:MAG: phytochelatin synthase [Archangium sp.]|nr:phytochelatin synthase [Archangium sp.]